MAVTDTSEKGLETLIVESLVNEAGYVQGTNDDYSREHVVDLAQLRELFLKSTQPEVAEAIALDQECPKRMQFLHRLDAEIAKRGVIDVLRKGVKHQALSLDLFYGTPTPGNTKAAELHAANIFSVTRQLSGFLRSGKKIIISTVQTFPFILDEIGDEHRGKKFAIIIDEAHSSQGGKTSAKMYMALSEQGGEDDEEETFEDKVNKIMVSRKMLANASYFAFTATPKNKTLEIFGIPGEPVDGKVPHRPFHSYTMKQAIQEGFISERATGAWSSRKICRKDNYCMECAQLILEKAKEDLNGLIFELDRND